VSDVRVELLASDFYVAERRQALYRGRSEVAYAYNDPRAEARQSKNFTTEDYERVTLYSLALEAALARRLGVPIKSSEDERTDLPNGVETMCRGPKAYHGGNPYVVERQGEFFPTLTAYIVPDREAAVDIRFLLTPDMVPHLRTTHAYAKSWGKTRHLVDVSSAVRCGGRLNLLERLQALVRGPAPEVLA